MEGQTVSHYRILEKIGEGGMGQVYLAEDTSLERKVALKFLPEYLHADPVAHKRLLREAKSAAAIDHPFICNIHEVAQTEDGQDFVVMEYVEGQTLKDRLEQGKLSIKEALQLGSEITDALEKAHKAGVVHRDLKPSNIMLTEEGHAKVMDFGLAKRLTEAGGEGGEITEGLTREGTTLGTLNYSSPEQLRGEPVNARSDIFSFGVVFYEMLTGVHPFRKETQAAIIDAIFNESARPLSHYTSEIPLPLQKTIERMLAKEPDRRFSTTGELTNTLRDCKELVAQRKKGLRQLFRQPITLAVAIVLIIVVAAGGTWLWLRYSRIRWVHNTAMPEVNRLIDEDRLYAAFRLLQKALSQLPEDAEVRRLYSMITSEISVVTDPVGAEVYVRDYHNLDGAWDYLGKTPVEGVPIPRTPLGIKIAKVGFEEIEVAGRRSMRVRLEVSGTRPAGMVRVRGRKFQYRSFKPVELKDFWIDKFEVTNEQYHEFLESGGYKTPDYWKEPFLDDGRAHSWEEVVADFVDQTGRPGPSTWEVGSFPQGEDQFPVGGVSWYEAAAYCKSQGKMLPTVYHWQLAATGPVLFSAMLDVSNFDKSGTTAVGKYKGCSAFGAYDMAGNVKEWCFNQSKDGRSISGGAWNESPYVFLVGDASSPFARDANLGFRCMKCQGEVEGDLLAPIRTLSPTRDYRIQKPVGDDAFEVIRAFYSYDRGELKAKVDAIDNSSEYWRRETVSFNGAYGGERVSGHLFLPRNAVPPLQTVIYFPGLDAMFQDSSEKMGFEGVWLEPIIKSGRAVFFPIYKGTFERRHREYPERPDEWTQLRIQWAKDLGRSIDYLESRPEIDSRRLAYCGYSTGAREGFNLTAVEQRFKASLLLAIGSRWVIYSPEMEPINFAPRIKTPTLMVQGRYDALTNLDAIVEPLYQALGVQEPDKRLVWIDSGHILPRLDVIKETLEWLDRYLGPVQD